MNQYTVVNMYLALVSTVETLNEGDFQYLNRLIETSTFTADGLDDPDITADILDAKYAEFLALFNEVQDTYYRFIAGKIQQIHLIVAELKRSKPNRINRYMSVVNIGAILARAHEVQPITVLGEVSIELNTLMVELTFMINTPRDISWNELSSMPMTSTAVY